MCLSGEELNNDELGHNKHMINGQILLGWVLEGRHRSGNWKSSFFLLCQHLPIKFIPSTPPIKFIPIKLFMNPTPLPIELLHLIFNQSKSDKPILSNPAVSDL